MARSHTKSGPGRIHGQCRLIADPTNGAHLGVTQPANRDAPVGGNWQGKKYLSYAEHDECTRAAMAFPYYGRARNSVTYDKRREAVEARR